MPIGTIKMWDASRGFGFIVDDKDSEGRGVFAHITAMPSNAVSVGDRFEYDIASGPDGRTKASNIRTLTAAREEAHRVFGG